jgi:multisubunit Na+/H+ antiporter MnhG subunit
MDHAITLGNVLTVVGIVGGFALVLALLIGVIVLTNPFGSGH